MVRLLSVTSESMCTKYWLIDPPDMTIAVDWDIRHLTKPSSFLRDIIEQCKTRSGFVLFAYRMYFQNLNAIESYYPTTLRFEMGLCCYNGLGNSLGIYGLNIAGNVRITAIK